MKIADLKYNNILYIDKTTKGKKIVNSPYDFYQLWLKFQAQCFHITEREIKVLAYMLSKRLEMLKDNSEEEIVKTLTTKYHRNIMAEELSYKDSHLQVILSRLRKKKIIENGIINKSVIPAIKGNKCAQLLIIFNCENLQNLQI